MKIFCKGATSFAKLPVLMHGRRKVWGGITAMNNPNNSSCEATWKCKSTWKLLLYPQLGVHVLDMIYIKMAAKSREYKERQVDEKYHKVFVTPHVVKRTAAMFLASAINRGNHPPEVLKIATGTGGKYFCLGHWLTTWRP